MALTVFVSYSSKDSAFVDRIRSAFPEDGTVRIFVAEHDIGPGQDLARSIEQAIEKCHLFVLLWSTRASDSEWVRHELGIAHGKNRTILPIRLEREALLPSVLGNIKYVDAADDTEQALLVVKQTILG